MLRGREGRSGLPMAATVGVAACRIARYRSRRASRKALGFLQGRAMYRRVRRFCSTAV